MGETFFNPFSLEGKTILVTGASSGIGKAIAIACSRMGATIMLNGRSTERLQAVKERLQGEKHAIFPIDLQNPEGCQSLAERLPELDGIVYCAGIGQRKLCKMITPSDVDEVMDINFKANVMLQAQLLSFRKIRKEASIVFIASKAASSPSFGNAIYTPVRDKKKSKELQLCRSFSMYWQSLRLVVKETICRECGAEVDEEVVYRAVA